MEEQKQPQKKKKLSRILYWILLLVLAAVFLYSGGALLDYYLDSRESQQTYDEIRDIKGDYTRPTYDPQATVPSEAATAPTESPYTTVTDPETGEPVEVLKEFAQLYTENPDIVGWLTIPDTNVDYPVVHRPEDPDWYLHRDFYGKYDSHGCLYLEEAADPFRPSDNLTVYGHRMKDGTMLGHLAKYESKDFWQSHQYFYFDTLRERHTYQIVYVFVTTASVGQGFEYHNFFDFMNQAEFDRFISGCASHAIYQTGVTTQFGDQFVTLSTCEYTHENGRLVLVAKRID